MPSEYLRASRLRLTAVPMQTHWRTRCDQRSVSALFQRFAARDESDLLLINHHVRIMGQLMKLALPGLFGTVVVRRPLPVRQPRLWVRPAATFRQDFLGDARE